MFSVPKNIISISLVLSSVAVSTGIKTSTALAQTQFDDLNNHWASTYINGLAQRNILQGYPDGSFRPNEPVTRAQFAAIIRNAFPTNASQGAIRFSDVKADHWAYNDITHAHQAQFLAGFGDGRFLPEVSIPRAQVLVSIASGLGWQNTGAIDRTLNRYSDAAAIPDYARPGIAAVSQRNIPISVPRSSELRPNETATRADIAAYIYRTLASQGKVAQLPQPNSPNLSDQQNQGALGTQFPADEFAGERTLAMPGTASLPVGTRIPVELAGAREGADKIVLAVGESVESAFLVADDVVDINQNIVIPEDSVLVGRFIPFDVEGKEGTRFSATKIYIDKVPYSIHANSVLFPAQKRSSFDPSELVGSVTRLGSGIVLDRVLSGDDSGGISPGVLIPTAIDTGTTLAKSIAGNSDGPSDKLILVEPSELGLSLDDEFQFLPGQSDSPVAFNSNQVDVGTLVQLGTPGNTLKYALLPGEEIPLDLKITSAISNRQGQLLIPAGSIVKGMIKTANTSNGEMGAQFVATTLYLDGAPMTINATTPLIAPVSLKSLNPSDFSGNIVATSQVSQFLDEVTEGESSSGGSGFLGLGKVFGSGGSKKKIILFNPQSSLMEFQAPLILDSPNPF